MQLPFLIPVKVARAEIMRNDVSHHLSFPVCASVACGIEPLAYDWEFRSQNAFFPASWSAQFDSDCLEKEHALEDDELVSFSLWMSFVVQDGAELLLGEACAVAGNLLCEIEALRTDVVDRGCEVAAKAGEVDV